MTGRGIAAARAAALATCGVLGVVTAIAGASRAAASAPTAPCCLSRPAVHAVPGSGRPRAQAAAGLRAAVRRTLGLPATAAGPAWSEQAELTQGTGHDQFGYSVAISGSTAVVGVPGPPGAGINPGTGAAYVFVRSGTAWSEQAELTAADATVGAYFGWSVAVSGSTAVVGAFGASAAYVFVRSGTAWSQQAELTAARGTQVTDFGYSVAFSGSTAVVGAYAGNSLTGAAYVFLRSGAAWSQQAELTAANATKNTYFGYSVAISGATVVVGAPGGSAASGTYVFVRSGTAWSLQARLTAADGARDSDFGEAVAASGSTVVVAVLPRGTTRGVAYVFVRSGTAWSQQAELTVAHSPAHDDFGWSVAIRGSTVMVGAPGDHSGTGAAYVFVRSGTAWSKRARLTAANGAKYDAFGWSVAISKSTAVVGAIDANSGTGAAYAFVQEAGQPKL